MIFDPPLIQGKLIRRYKRFLADIALPDDGEMTVHCPNPGAMAGLKDPGNPVWISDSGNPKRKLRHTLELMQVGPTLVGINTNRANAIALEAMKSGLVDGIDPASTFRAEQRYGEASRIDYLVEPKAAKACYVEVKNVHYVREPGLHEFPDSVTARGAKHLREMMAMIDAGHRAMMLFVIQRNDGDRFSIADDIDPVYGKTFKAALRHGVEARAITCHVTPQAVTPENPVKIIP